ncbi:MAG TPA: MATE family efflux transporter [Candidatus Spyradenecus faecavium]|uniref:Multidrug-efflux transporter n=1 Tax=Candidatus Spyradenecus faecavium TaxID=2840947 RepID=A0A9D1NNT7_9BACT|nr:MATE family efflux transporter [Candidatus Spyradenecus faecavium]
MTTDMTRGAPLRLLVAFSWPLLVGNVIQMAYALADMIIVGRLLGERALAAVGGVGSTIFVVLGFVFGITAGVAVVTAQRFGAGDPRGVRHSVGTGVWVSAAIAGAVTLACWLCVDLILRLLNTPPDVFAEAREYLSVSFLGTPLMVFFNFQSATLRALGDSRTPLFFLAGASLLNVVLDILFISAFDMGVGGAAWATNTAIFSSALACLLLVTRRLPELRLSLSDWRPRPRMALRQLWIALPMGLQFSVTGLGAMVLQAAINTFGVAQMAGMTAARNVENVACQLPVALGQAMATYAAQNFGAGRLARIRAGVRASVLITVACGVVMTALTLLFGDLFVAAFLRERSAEVLAVGRRMLWVTAPFFVPLGLIFIFRNTLQGIGRSLLPMLAGFVEMAMRMGVALGLLHVLGVNAVYWGDPAAWVGAAVLLVVAYWAYSFRWPREREAEPCP